MRIKYPGGVHDTLPDDDPLVKSIKEEGVLHTPILISSTGWIIKGRRRWLACKHLGMPDDKIPVIVEKPDPIWLLYFTGDEKLELLSVHKTKQEAIDWAFDLWKKYNPVTWIESEITYIHDEKDTELGMVREAKFGSNLLTM